ncbi:MAG: hypothetical protein HY315_09210 [Acidobacteria bacterium]|nr:hypothetical protein [Acidobacteriota bacterium]
MTVIASIQIRRRPRKHHAGPPAGLPGDFQTQGGGHVACQGISFLEVTVALGLSLGALLLAAPALGLALRVLVHEQKSLDQEIALEAAWSEICAGPDQFASGVIKDYRVGSGRNVTVAVEAPAQQDGLMRWKLTVSDPPYSEERWLAR